MRKISIFILFSMLICAGAEASAETHSDARSAVAEKLVGKNVFAIFVKGLICDSCGIGVKKKAGKLSFLDKTKLDKGLKVDSKNQLLYFAVKPGQSADTKAVCSAIRDAGYTPVSLYLHQKGKLVHRKVN